MSTHNICFHAEIRKYLLDTPPLLSSGAMALESFIGTNFTDTNCILISVHNT